jgi:hypothetical protein
MLVKSFERLNISAASIQMFKDRLEKMRQSAPHSNLEDTYVMGGILIYCGILLENERYERGIVSCFVSDFYKDLRDASFS